MPRTGFGRVIISICALFGVIVMSVIVVSATQFLSLETNESQAYTLISKVDMTK